MPVNQPLQIQKNQDPLASIRQVFGDQWQPSPAFNKDLQAKGIYGAVRVGESPNVFTLGPGGTLETAETYKQKFGTDSQEGIVGVISPEQAAQLGIKPESINTPPKPIETPPASTSEPTGTTADEIEKEPEAETTPIDPYKTFTDFYAKIVQDSGMLDIKNEFNRVQKEYNDLTKEESNEIMAINDNPWLSEGLRQRKVANIQEKYQSQKDSLTRQMTLYEGLYDAAKQDAQFTATQATQSAHNQAVLDQNLLLAKMDSADKLLSAQKGTTDIQEYEYAKSQGYKGSFTDYQKEQANLKLSTSGVTTPTSDWANTLGIAAKDASAFNTAFQEQYEKVLAGTYGTSGAREKAGKAMIAKYPQYANQVWKVVYGSPDEGINALFPNGYESDIKSASNVNQETGLNTNLSANVKGNVEALKAANASVEDIKSYIRAEGYDPESNESKLLLKNYPAKKTTTGKTPSLLDLTQFGKWRS